MRPSVCTLLAVAFVCGALAPRVDAHLPLDEKEAAVDKALRDDADDPALHIERAALYRQRHDWDGAAASYLRAATLGADREQIDIALAEVFLQAGLPLTAEMYVERVCTHHPDDAHAVITRARIRKTLDRRQDSAADFERGVGLLSRPDPDLVREAMAAQVAVDRPEVALRIADAAAQKIGPVASVQLPAIEIELKLGHREAALARYDSLLAQAPRHEIWLAERGDILDEMGRREEARAAYTRALALIRERPPARRTEKIVDLQLRLQAKLAAGTETPER